MAGQTTPPITVHVFPTALDVTPVVVVFEILVVPFPVALLLAPSPQYHYPLSSPKSLDGINYEVSIPTSGHPRDVICVQPNSHTMNKFDSGAGPTAQAAPLRTIVSQLSLTIRKGN